MYKFSEISKRRLAECHIDLQVLFNEIIEHRDCSILCGFRNKADQDRAYLQGFSKKKFPNSKHNTVPLSSAVDVMPYPIKWDDIDGIEKFAHLVLAVANRLYYEGKMSKRIRWGGDWNSNKIKDEKFYDLPHYEIY